MAICDGQAVSRTDYAALFEAIKMTHGAGDGSTTFNLPDHRGRVMLGLDNMGGTSANRITAPWADSLGAGGAETVTSIEAQMPRHSHEITGTYTADNGSGGGGAFPHGSARSTLGRNISSFLNLTNSEAGSGQPHPNVQPSLAINIIIKT